MKYLVLAFLTLFSFYSKSQTLHESTYATQSSSDLIFDRSFINCEDQWIAMSEKEGKYTFGFVYIDCQAGLTLDRGGSFTINEKGQYQLVQDSLTKVGIKYRLSTENNFFVARIPNEHFEEIGVAEYPDWLASYKKGIDSAKCLFSHGFIYNEWNECNTALNYLNQLAKIDSSYPGMNFEFAYAYNCLKLYDKAIPYTKALIKSDSTDCLGWKELIYGQLNSGLIFDAASSAEKMLSHCNNNGYKGEATYNVAQHFYKANDKMNYKKWKKISLKFLSSESYYRDLLKSDFKVVILN